MATIKLSIPKSRKKVGGEIPVRILISHRNKSLYIATPYYINSEKEFSFGSIIGRPDASAINVKLRNRLNYIQAILDKLPIESMSCSQIKGAILRCDIDSTTILSFSKQFIKNLLTEKRISYATNMTYSVNLFADSAGGDIPLRAIDQTAIINYEFFLRSRQMSDTTISIRMAHIKALLNQAVCRGIVSFNIFPFAGYKMPRSSVRDLALSVDEIQTLRDFQFPPNTGRNYIVARDMFMLSFYLGGINLIDILKARFDSDTITFIRSKTAKKKTANCETSFSIPHEARTIIDRYIKNGKICLGYHFKEYGYLRSMLTHALNKLGIILGFERTLVFYSARKSFCQYGFELGIPLYILEYAIGQTIKEANNRPIFSYIKIMRPHADDAIRKIIDYIN